MKYSIAFAAVAAVAQASTMIPIPYGAPPAAATTPAVSSPPAPPAPEGPKTSTAFVTDEVTVISCGPSVTNCPGKSTWTVDTPVPNTPTSPAYQAPPPPPTTTPVATTTTPPAVPTPPPAPPAVSSPSTPVVVNTPPPAAPPAPPTPVISTQAYTTCVPTTIYQTVTITETTSSKTTPVATTAPYATGNVGGGYATGTGVVPKPSGPAIISSNGAADLSASFGGMALAAAAVILFA